MSHPARELARAADYAESAFRMLVAVMIVVEEAGFEIPEEIGLVVEDVADLSAGFLQMADDYAKAEVMRRCG